MNTLKIVSIISIVFLFSACETNLNIGCLNAEGADETRTMDFDDFSDITIGLACTVNLTQGPDHEVIIEAATNIIDRIESDSRKSGDVLDLEINGCSRIDENDVTINITLPSLVGIQIDGAAEITGTNTFTIENDLDLGIDGAGEITLDIEEADLLKIEIDGAGDITITGDADDLEADIDGAGTIDASNLTARIVEAKIDGAGDIECDLTEELTIEIKGTGDVEATGTALKQDIIVDGGGRVRNFGLSADDTDIEIDGIADVEVLCNNNLSVKIDGAGDVCFRGNPTIGDVDISGLGQLNDCN